MLSNILDLGYSQFPFPTSTSTEDIPRDRAQPFAVAQPRLTLSGDESNLDSTSRCFALGLKPGATRVNQAWLFHCLSLSVLQLRRQDLAIGHCQHEPAAD